MTVPTRVAIVGAAGWAGRRHISAFTEAGARIAALIDPDPAVQELANAVGADVVESTSLLRVETIDLVVVSLPSSAQPEVCAELLRRGFRVLVEKPVGSTGANAAGLGTLENIDDALMVGYTLHQHPIANELASWISTVNVISISVRSAARKLSIDSWRARPDEGGVVVVNGIHAIEYVAHLVPGIATVRDAFFSSALHGTEVADYAAATVSFQDGPVFHLETYWSPWNHTSGLNGNDWFLEVDVVAKEGRRLWANWSLHAWDRLGSESVRNFPEIDLFAAQAKAAIEFANGAPPTVGYRQALRATELADAVLRHASEQP